MSSATAAAAAATDVAVAANDSPRTWTQVAQKDLDEAMKDGLIDEASTAYVQSLKATNQVDSSDTQVKIVLDLTNFEKNGIKYISIRSMVAIIAEIIKNGTPVPGTDRRIYLPKLPQSVLDVVEAYSDWLNSITDHGSNWFVSELYIEIRENSDSDRADEPYHSAGFPALMWILVAKTRGLKAILKKVDNPNLMKFKDEVEKINAVLDQFYVDHNKTTIVKFVSNYLYKKAEERRAAILNKPTYNYHIPSVSKSDAAPKSEAPAKSVARREYVAHPRREQVDAKMARLPFPAVQPREKPTDAKKE